MQCQSCQKRPATVHLTQIVDDVVKKVDLCADCSKERGIEDPSGASLAELLMGMGVQQQETKPNRRSNERRCPVCGYSQSDFESNGRFGCPECYEAFADELVERLPALHRGTRHVGKAPAALALEFERNARIRELEKKLEVAVDAEEFEMAAKYRDALAAEHKDDSQALRGNP